MAAYKLILLPTEPQCPPLDCARLASELQAIQLIGEPVAVDNGVFYPTGKHFLQHISFLGCSPAIELEPPSDPAGLSADSAAGKFCHVFLHSSTSLCLRADQQCPPPRCPKCRQPCSDWRTTFSRGQQNPARTDWNCSGCGFSGQLTDLCFRKAAGIGHTFIEIRGIYPSEAVPTDALLNRLQRLSGGPWRTIYIRE
ncbi:MAG: hypothetical protein OEU63_01955 [Gammaproteobacteria bacterium]|nr:hypothetical protein [Gammaproteobacteria bacterium]